MYIYIYIYMYPVVWFDFWLPTYVLRITEREEEVSRLMVKERVLGQLSLVDCSSLQHQFSAFCAP